jgi:acyl carrier protein
VIRHLTDCCCLTPICGAVFIGYRRVFAAGTAVAPAWEAESVDDVTTKVVKIISGHLGIDADLVIPAASLIDDLGADSLDTVELVIAFEEAFDIEIPEADVERIRTVKDAVEYVLSRTTSG